MMTLHVLHAGDGYTYLTRQVASADVTRRRGEALTDYYAAEGNPPGRWMGTGRAAMDVHGRVSEAQMKALFGQGLHPDAGARIQAAVARGLPAEEAEAAVRLGRRFPVIDHTGEDWRHRLDTAYEAFHREQGRRPQRGPERDLIRWTVATELFQETQQREPTDDAELKAFIARVAKPARQPVAGVDLVFTPVKSVSILWALGDDNVRVQVAAAHEAAWQRAFAFIEREAALTRTGTGGIAQVDTNGLVAAAFDHADSRSGDPNLHTHVAVSAKVQGLDGAWRALDLRVLHALAVAASETYNTAVEDELRTRLGVRFVERAAGRGKRPVREIDGIPPELLRVFSSRRAQVESGYEQALARYRAAHGHDPPRAVQYRLAQEATLAGRPAKDPPRSWADARAEWLTRAGKVLSRSPFGLDGDVERLVRRVAGHDTPNAVMDETSRQALAQAAVQAVAQSRSTWTRWHIRAEVHRLSRELNLAPHARDGFVDEVTERALTRECLLLEAPEANPAPDALCRRDGASVYSVHGMARYTSERVILAVEDRLLAAARERTTVATPDPVLDAAGAALEREHGWAFDTGQVALARSFVCDDRRLVVGVGPAGTGKTTAMQLAARALAADGRRLVAVAPSARAAAVLGRKIGAPATTLAKFLHAHCTVAELPPELVLDRGDVVLVDEAGMAGTPALGRLLEVVTASDAVLRLVGDPMQLSAVEAGGALRLLTQHGDAAVLDRMHRFADPAEATASLQLRRGNPAALGFYDARGRLTDGSRQRMLEEVYLAWRQDQAAGYSTLMVSASSVEVAGLCARTRADRVTAGDVEPDGVRLHDGNQAGTGDVVVTRANRRTLAVLGGRDFVKNGDLWRVTARHRTGELTLAHLGHGGSVRLPAEYAGAHLELGYATTVHRAQGMTVDSAHVLVDQTMCRESLYVAMSRGRSGNHAYVVTDEMLDVELHHQPTPRVDAVAVLTGVLAREGSERSATETIQQAVDAAESLSTLVPRYLDALARAVLTPEVEAAVRAGLRDAGGPALEHHASHAPGWRRLLVASAGPRARETVAEAARCQLLDAPGVHDVAGLLAARVAQLGPEYSDGVGMDSGESWRPPWLPAPTALGLSDPVAAWVIRQDRLVCQRVHALVEQVAADPPAWASSIVRRPDSKPERAAWDRDVATVVAYRDQHGIPDHLAQPVISSSPREGGLAVRRSWVRLHRDDQAAPGPPETVARLREFAARPGPDYGELLRPQGMPMRRPPDRPAQADLAPRGPRR